MGFVTFANVMYTQDLGACCTHKSGNRHWRVCMNVDSEKESELKLTFQPVSTRSQTHISHTGCLAQLTNHRLGVQVWLQPILILQVKDASSNYQSFHVYWLPISPHTKSHACASMFHAVKMVLILPSYFSELLQYVYVNCYNIVCTPSHALHFLSRHLNLTPVCSKFDNTKFVFVLCVFVCMCVTVCVCVFNVCKTHWFNFLLLCWTPGLELTSVGPVVSQDLRLSTDQLYKVLKQK